MNQSEALSVVRSLANGVDPASGEAFPAQSLYQRADIVRALFVAAEALERSERFSRRREDLPSKAGQPWTEDEDRKLLASFDAGRGASSGQWLPPTRAAQSAAALARSFCIAGSYARGLAARLEIGKQVRAIGTNRQRCRPDRRRHGSALWRGNRGFVRRLS